MTEVAYSLPFEHKQFAQMGYLITIWNQAELLLNICIVVALQLDMDTGDAIIGETTITHRARILNKAGKTRLDGRPGMLALLEDATKSLQDLAPYRNDIAHAKWVPLAEIKGSRRIIMDKLIDFSQIDSKTEEMAILTNQLAVLLFALFRPFAEQNGLTLEGQEQTWRDRLTPRIPLD